MPTIIKNVPALLGKLLIWRASLYVMSVVLSASLAALTGLDWATANNQTRLMVIMGIAGTAAGTLAAYIDQTASRVAKGEAPFVDIPLNVPAPGTVEKTVTSQVSTTVTPS